MSATEAKQDLLHKLLLHLSLGLCRILSVYLERVYELDVPCKLRPKGLDVIQCTPQIFSLFLHLLDDLIFVPTRG